MLDFADESALHRYYLTQTFNTFADVFAEQLRFIQNYSSGYRSLPMDSSGSTLALTSGFVLPTSAESFVQRHHCQELIALGAGQIQLRGEELLLRFEDLVITRFAGG